MTGYFFPRGADTCLLGQCLCSRDYNWEESCPDTFSLRSLQCPEAPHPLLPAQPLFVQRPQQHLLLVQQQQQPLSQSKLLPEPQPQPQPEQDPH